MAPDKPATMNDKFLEVQMEQARELRRIGREAAEMRKVLTKIFLILQAQEVARMEAMDEVVADGDAEFPIYHRAHPDYNGPQPDGYVDVRDMGVTS